MECLIKSLVLSLLYYEFSDQPTDLLLRCSQFKKRITIHCYCFIINIDIPTPLTVKISNEIGITNRVTDRVSFSHS